MKKATLLLFITCLFWCPLLLNAQNNDELFDLSPKIEKGDSWKIVIDLGETQTTWNNDKKDLENFPKNILGVYGLKDLRVKTKWEVECLNTSKERIILKFTFRRLEQKNTMTENGKNFLNYNDTDFPLDLSTVKMEQINLFLNKSFTCEVPWNTEEKINILENDFEYELMNLPTTTFMNKGMSKLMKINFGMHSKAYAGPNAVLINLNLQRSIYPKNPVKVGDTWMSEFVFGGDTISQQMTLKSVKEGRVIINTNFEGITKEISINLNSGLPQIFDLIDILKVYSYDNPICNSQISGDFQNKDFNGIATFKINYPVTSDKIKVVVKNGVFEMPIDLKEPVSGVFTFQDIKTDFFLTPGMSVKINWKNGQVKAEGFGANDLNAVFLFSENPFYYGYSTDDQTVKIIKEKTNTYLEKVESILKQFKNSLSIDCERYIKTESNFRIAYWYALSTEDIERERTAPKLYGKNFDPVIADENYNFFLNYVDSIPLLGSVSPYSDAYHSFIVEYLNLRQRNFLYELGRRRTDDNYRENLLFAAIQYVGYPYFYSSYKILESQVLEGNAAQIKKELEEFYSLPCNPVFKNALIDLIKEMGLIKPGKIFPFTEVTDIDGLIQKIPKGELCAVDLQRSFSMQSPQHKEELEELTRIIKEDNRINKINYVVIRADFAKGKMIETPSNDTVNFIHIYLPKGDDTLLEKCQVPNNGRRILLLDKNQKIVNNNLERIQKYSGHDFPKVLDDYFESQNQPKSYKNRIAVILGALSSLLLIALTAWLAVRITTKQVAKKESARRKLSELELKAIRSQMNPHFIFNAMGSIQNLINQNNTKNANLYLSSFAKLMRMVLANSNKKLVSLSDELELLKHYLELEQLRVDFQFEINLDENIDPETEEIPGMLVQPFVENAIIHGITPKGKGTVVVQFSKYNEILVCKIIDDGVGINTSGAGNGNGVAMKLAGKRLDLLNSQLQTKLRLTVENRKEIEKSEGTKITLLIPVG